LCVVSPRVESSPGKTSTARGPEAAARTPPPLYLRASPSPATAGYCLVSRPQPTAVTSSSSVSAPWSLPTRWTLLLPSGTHCRHRACHLAMHYHGQPTLVSPSPPRAPNQPFRVASHLPDTSPPPPHATTHRQRAPPPLHGASPCSLPLFDHWATIPRVAGMVWLGRPFRPKGTMFLIISPADFV
jgi:hypothetical protein